MALLHLDTIIFLQGLIWRSDKCCMNETLIADV